MEHVEVEVDVGFVRTAWIRYGNTLTLRRRRAGASACVEDFSSTDSDAQVESAALDTQRVGHDSDSGWSSGSNPNPSQSACVEPDACTGATDLSCNEADATCRARCPKRGRSVSFIVKEVPESGMPCDERGEQGEEPMTVESYEELRDGIDECMPQVERCQLFLHKKNSWKAPSLEPPRKRRRIGQSARRASRRVLGWLSRRRRAL